MAQHSGNPRRESTRVKRSFRRSLCTVSVLALMTAAAAGFSPAQAFENLTQAEREALTVRHLQSDMMVAALSCQMRGEYNETVTRFQDELVRHGANLRALFRRTYGSGAERELNSYITRLANESSTRRIAAGASYCGEAAGQFARLDALSQTQLAAFSIGEVSVAAVPAAGPRLLPIREATLPR